jgi:hypothetical protein
LSIKRYYGYKIKTRFNENDNKYNGFILGTKEDNQISYHEEKISVAIILESDKITLLRESEDYKIELTFINNLLTNGSCYLKKEESTIPLKVMTNLLVVKENSIELKYTINTKEGESYFILEYEVLK